LEPWREVVVFLSYVLVWTKPWFPAVIFVAVNIPFLMYWYFSPSLLTAISLVSLTVSLLDFCVPQISALFIPTQYWTAAKEMKFEKVCQSLIKHQEIFTNNHAKLHNLKVSHPKLYFGVLILFLSFMAWFGNQVNNLFLIYILVLFIALYPGIRQNGFIEVLLSKIFSKIAEILRKVSTTKTSDQLKKEN